MISLLLGLLACGTSGTDSADTSGGGGDTGDPDADELPYSGSCPAASGLLDGATWEYVYNSTWEDANDRAGGWTMSAALADDGTTWEVVTELDVAGSNNTLVETNTYGYGCDADGLWLLTQYTESVTTVSEPYEGWREYTYDAPVLIMPATTEVGDIWDSVYTGTWTNELGQTRTAGRTLTYEIIGVEAVETEAGSWNAMIWTETTSTGVVTTSHRVSGLGMVSSQDADLVAYTQ